MTTPDPTVPRWTPETEERGLRALWKFGHLGQPIGSDAEPAAIAWTRSAVRAVLTAAADCGALVTPEMTAVLAQARRTAAEVARWEVDDPTLLDLCAAVDALEARPHPDTTGAAA